MGPLLVASMVHGGIEDPSTKKLHPFFARGGGCSEESAGPVAHPPSFTVDQPSIIRLDAEDDRRKRQRTDTIPGSDELGLNTPQSGENHVGTIVDRPLTSFFNKINHTSTTSGVAPSNSNDNIPTPPPRSDASAQTSQSGSTAPATAAPGVSPAVPTAMEKKVLKFNPRTGTLGSPPKPKKASSPSRVVCIKYGQDGEGRSRIGSLITQILAGTWEPPQTPSKKRAPRKKAKDTANTNSTPKPRHPFFSSNTTSASENSAKGVETPRKASSRRNTVFMSTPVSPRKAKNPFASSKTLQFGTRSAGTKIPGAMHPLWPAQGVSHVRGDDITHSHTIFSSPQSSQSKKSKGQVTAITTGESILEHLGGRLNLDVLRAAPRGDPNSFTPAPSELRMPRCHFESGRKLQKRIAPQLRTLTKRIKDDESSQDELSLAKPPNKINNTSVSRLYDSLESTLSAYDKSTCENLSWVTKYSPTAASQVLQAGKEADLLKQWLEGLRVQSVESGGSDDKNNPKGDTAPRKKRKKNKLDGFVVDSDEEENELDELSDHEGEWAPPGMGLLKKSVVRSGGLLSKGAKGSRRLVNAVIMSGPHGSGKTATVYAVARELGFEIFEIHPGGRRSGKDILEKVGDMTRNHLVQQHRSNPENGEPGSDKIADEIKSGKQGTMASFFKPQTTSAAKPARQDNDKAKGESIAKPIATKAQRQSLILIEEVDVLYEEDKQFWATLITMIAQSKRPFVMTCNDESLVPIQSLKLHAIFRFSSPPIDLAVDTCLLIAANEGHALQRASVEYLYRSRKYDLRATITELNFWCQFGVGDRKGGLDWFFLRWPKGSDLDENGDVVRVVSEDTYLKGMGWLSRDLIASTTDPLEAENESIDQTWNSWGVDMGAWQDSKKMSAWAHEESEPHVRSESAMATLEAYDDFCKTMSDADLCSALAYGSKLQEELDPTIPDLPSDAKEDFIIGQTLLEAEPAMHHHSPSTGISISLKSLARHNLHAFSTQRNATFDSPSMMQPINESAAVSILDSVFRSQPYQLTRLDLAHAFDPIAVSPKATITTHLDPSVFDRTLNLIVLDVAPWVRGIVAFDHKLMQGRARLGNLLSEGGTRKRMRSTRTAYSALEGGERRTTRRERYFGDVLNTNFVIRTGGGSWQDAVAEPTAGSDYDESMGYSTASVHSSPPE